MPVPFAAFAPRIAVMIDADNMSWKYAHEVVNAVQLQSGSVVYSAYGREASCEGWVDQLKAFKPRSISPDATGKPNVADMTLMLDAMVYMLRHRVKHMYLVTSDTDFVPLLRKLKVFNCHSVLLADERANETLRKSCDEFVLLKPA